MYKRVYPDNAASGIVWDNIEMDSRTLGFGDQGEVKKCRVSGMGKEVFAVKTCREVSSLAEVLPLIQQIMGAGGHNNVVQTHAVFSGKRNFVLLMEYANLDTLDALRRLLNFIPERPLLLISKQILSGLEFLHQRNVIHRDLKPPNIVLCSSGLAKITDFGYSKNLTLTASSGATTTLGTRAYFSPERAKGVDYRTNADIWALGVIVAECAIGFYPVLDEENFIEAEQRIENSGVSVYDAVAASLSDFLLLPLLNDSTRIDFDNLLMQSRERFEFDGPMVISNGMKDFVQEAMRPHAVERPSATDLLNHYFIPAISPEETQSELRQWFREIDAHTRLKEARRTLCN